MSEQDSNQNKSSKTRIGILLVLLVLALATPVTILVLLGIGQMHGVEFSPDDFSRRSFSYNQMPVTGWVVFKKKYEDQTTDLEKSLIATRLVRPVVLKQKRWHLISEFGSPVISHQCDARFLTNYLDKYDEDGASYWDTWNTDYPKCAKVFWPEVAELARDQMYLKVADVMRVGMSVSKDNPKRFDRSLRSVLSDVYLELSSLDAELGRLERAEYRIKRALQHGSSVKKSEQMKNLAKKLISIKEQNGTIEEQTHLESDWVKKALEDALEDLSESKTEKKINQSDKEILALDEEAGH